MNLAKTKERFAAKALLMSNECWEWQGPRTSQGYGQFKSFGEQLAHRVSFILHIGPLPKDACVLHRCDNPPCVNPEHFFLGNRDVNNKDRAAKGRTVVFHSLKTHCKHGHEFDKENTYFRPAGTRGCRKCAAIRALKIHHLKRRGLR